MLVRMPTRLSPRSVGETMEADTEPFEFWLGGMSCERGHHHRWSSSLPATGQ